MTKFNTSVARRFAEVGDYVDSLDTESRVSQRAAARMLSDPASHNLREIARAIETERSAIPFSLARAVARAEHQQTRTSRRRERARARAQKEMLREDTFA